MVLKFFNKRGVGIVFNWIFSLIAGVFILSFLVYFAVQNTDLFGKVTARVVAEELDIVFSGYETTETSSQLDFGKNIELSFKCEGGKQEFEVNGVGGKKIWDKVIFAPKEIKSNEVNIATRSWNIPFRAANFIFIWGNQRYNLVGNSGGFEVPENFESSNGENVNFELIGNLAGEYSEIRCPSNDGKVIKYERSEELEDFGGKVCFGGDGEVFYGEAMMLGAVLSETKEEFSCVKEVIQSRLDVMKSVYENKKNNLGRFCTGGYYGRFSNAIPSNVEKLNVDNVDTLKSYNERILNKGCASAY